MALARTEFKRRSPLELVEKVCPQCGETFTCPVSEQLRRVNCSRACQDRAHRTKVERVCRQCGESYWYAPSQSNHYKGAGQFCSKKCHGAAVIEKNKDAPIKDRYGRSRRQADLEWQAAVRKRDGWICQRCGKYDQQIHAHHVAPRGRRPDLKHDVDNGKCLCGSCHHWVHHNPTAAHAEGLLSDAKYERRAEENR